MRGLRAELMKIFVLCLGLGMLLATPVWADDFAALSQKAQTGDAQAEYELGLRYRRGQGTPLDAVAAETWLNKAAAQGYALAEYELGRMYVGSSATGEFGLMPNRELGIQLLLKAAGQGEGKAELTLSNLCTQRLGAPQAAEGAQYWVEKAKPNLTREANEGDADAASMLSMLIASQSYETSPNGEKISIPLPSAYRYWQDKALDIYHQSGTSGDNEAKLSEAMLLAMENFGDSGTYRPLIKEAADAGVVQAELYMATLAEGKPDYPEMLKWYKKASAQNSSEAQIQLAMIYYEGKGVDKDVAQTVTWMQAAAQNGSSIAQFMLGELYSDYYAEHAIPVDMAAAEKWYLMAAKQGSGPAQFRLANGYYEGRLGPKDNVKAYAWQLIMNDEISAHNATVTLDLVAYARSGNSSLNALEAEITDKDRQAAQVLAASLMPPLP